MFVILDLPSQSNLWGNFSKQSWCKISVTSSYIQSTPKHWMGNITKKCWIKTFFCKRLDNKTFTERTKFKQNLNKSSGLCLDLFKELQCYVSDEKLRT